MYVYYENAKFHIQRDSSIERTLFKQAIKKRIGRFLGKPYQQDPYLTLAYTLLKSIKSPTVVDVGTNIGTTVLPLAVKFPEAQFYAVEPHPIPASRFIQNCALNEVNQVQLVSTAIASKEHFATIHTCPTNSGGHRLTGFEGRKDLLPSSGIGSIQVPTKPLNTLFREWKIPRCDLLKIDTEGYEFFVLESLEESLDPEVISCAIVEFGPEGLRQTGKSGWDLVSLMLGKGYDCRILGTNQPIRKKEDLPYVPDFSVIDFVFQATSRA